jgi:thiol:disulfide interchange protein/DsbC/DsbD-like thiol-disulfide interchange protein
MWMLLVADPALASTGTASEAPPPPPAVSFDAVPASAAARGPENNGKPHPVLARLLVDSATVAPGSKVRVGVHLTQDEGWHTYWKSPGDIGQPTVIEWQGPEGSVLSEVQFPIPQRFEQDGMVSFGYDHQVLLASTLEIPAALALGEHTLAADVNWLVCLTSCIPGSAHLELPLTVAAGTTPSAQAPLFDHYASQHPGPPTGLGTQFQLSASAVHPNEKFRAAFVLTANDGVFGEIPTAAWPTFTPIAGFDWGVTGVTVRRASDKELVVVVEGETYEPDPLPPEPQSIGGLVQVKIGDRWVRTEVAGTLPWVASGLPVVSNANPVFDPPNPLATAAAATSTGAGLISNLLLALLGGLILNVMPCVLPVLTLKLYGLVEQTDITAGQRRATGLAYTGGVVASFLALAAIIIVLRSAFGLQVDWGFQFQYPPYVAALTTIVFAFGLSMLGVFEIPVIGAEAADSAANREGLAGSFFTGVFATLLATPCSAPFLGTAIAYAFGAPTHILLAIFTAVGIGLAAPFLLVAFVPFFFRFLPRPGAWMDVLKQVLGFTLLATTVWLIDVMLAQIGPDRTSGYLAFLVAVGMACWMYGRFGGVAASWRAQGLAAGAGAAIAAAAGWYFLDFQLAEDESCDDGSLAADLSFQDEIPWQAFTEPRIQALAGKTVFIDFTAEWCLTCKVNERTVLETESVRGAMADLGVVPLKADWTRRDEIITTWLRQHGRAGVPMYLVIPGDRARPPILLPEVITPQMVVDALNTAS